MSVSYPLHQSDLTTCAHYNLSDRRVPLLPLHAGHGSVQRLQGGECSCQAAVGGYTNTLYPDSGLLPHPAAEGGDVSCYGGEDGLPQDHSLLPSLLQQTEVGGALANNH